MEHFARDGYGQTAVEAIAATAGVGNGTVYRRFGSKEKLFFSAMGYCIDVVWQCILKSTEGIDDPIAALRALCGGLIEHHRQHPQTLELIMIERAEFRASVYPTHLRHRRVHQHDLVELMSRAMQASHREPVVSPEDAANAFADLMFGSAANGCLEGDGDHLAARMATALEIFLRGLVGDALDESRTMPIRNR